MDILNRHPAKNKMAIICIDEHYKRYNTFPEDIRGVPTIHLEQGNNITAYEGKHAVEFVENLMVKATQVVEAPTAAPAANVPDWAAAAQTLTPDKVEELKKKGAGEYDASFLRDPRFKGKGNDDSEEKRLQQAKLAELQKEYGGGNAPVDTPQTGATEPGAKPNFNDVMSGKTNAAKGNLLK